MCRQATHHFMSTLTHSDPCVYLGSVYFVEQANCFVGDSTSEVTDADFSALAFSLQTVQR